MRKIFTLIFSQYYFNFIFLGLSRFYPCSSTWLIFINGPQQNPPSAKLSSDSQTKKKKITFKQTKNSNIHRILGLPRSSMIFTVAFIKHKIQFTLLCLNFTSFSVCLAFKLYKVWQIVWILSAWEPILPVAYV